MRTLFIAIAALWCISQAASAQGRHKTYAATPGKVQQLTLEQDYAYMLFTPSSTSAQQDGKFPLLVFLHGSGERGNDLDKVKVHGPPKVAEREADFPFMVLSPQCPAGETWDPHQLMLLVDEVVATHPVDPKRIYLTGLSMGGFGAWALALAYPDRFAALVPVCGGGAIKYLEIAKLKHTPTWVFHGAMDEVVPIRQSTKLVRALRKAGGQVEFTVYPDAGHDSWTATYDNPALYEWFLAQSLK